jgi:predicted nucleotidyltransferase
LLLRIAVISSILRRAVTSGWSKEEGTGSIMRPSISLENNRSRVREVLQRFGMTNPRVFGSAARGEDTDKSDLDILVDAPPGTSLYDLAAVEVELEAILGCKVEVLTKGFLASDVAERAEIDLLPIP